MSQHTHAIQMNAYGEADVLHWTAVELPEPAPHEVRIRHTAIGLNYIDVYHRRGMYPAPLPFTPGLEAAGVVEAVGTQVRSLATGDRIAYASLPLGAYAEVRNLSADRCLKLPEGISDRQAAAGLLKGMTAEYLLHRIRPVQRGDTVLIHAAAGGVGLILTRWAKALGVRVIGTCGSEVKARLAVRNGCDHAIDYTRENFVERVQSLTDRRGVDIVYDSVGRDTLMDSLACLRPRGMLVSFGQSSGMPDPLSLPELGRGSFFLTRPSLMAYTETREELTQSAERWFAAMRDGTLDHAPPGIYPLKDAAQAHRDLEARRTSGANVLIPDG